MLLFFSLFSICTTNILIICFFLWYTHSHGQNKKSTTKIKNQPQNQQQNYPETPQNQTHPHTDTLTETERVDRGLWQISVLGLKCLDRRSSRHAWIEDRESGSALVRIGVLGLECLDRRSSRHAWIGDRESGSVLVVDRRAWIGVILVVLGSVFFSALCSLLGSKFQKVWNREEWNCWDRE